MGAGIVGHISVLLAAGFFCDSPAGVGGLIVLIFSYNHSPSSGSSGQGLASAVGWVTRERSHSIHFENLDLGGIDRISGLIQGFNPIKDQSK